MNANLISQASGKKFRKRIEGMKKVINIRNTKKLSYGIQERIRAKRKKAFSNAD